MNILCKLGFHEPMHHVWVVFDDGTLHKKCSRCGKALERYLVDIVMGTERGSSRRIAKTN